MSTMIRLPWTPEEDEYLLKAVAKWGVKRWAQVAQGLPGRTSKAASHRYRTYLMPGVRHTATEPFSEWEVAVLQEAHKVVGNNWQAIAKMLPGRTNAAVKNHWYSDKRRNLRASDKLKVASAATKFKRSKRTSDDTSCRAPASISAEGLARKASLRKTVPAAFNTHAPEDEPSQHTTTSTGSPTSGHHSTAALLPNSTAGSWDSPVQLQVQGQQGQQEGQQQTPCGRISNSDGSSCSPSVLPSTMPQGANGSPVAGSSPNCTTSSSNHSSWAADMQLLPPLQPGSYLAGAASSSFPIGQEHAQHFGQHHSYGPTPSGPAGVPGSSGLQGFNSQQQRMASPQQPAYYGAAAPATAAPGQLQPIMDTDVLVSWDMPGAVFGTAGSVPKAMHSHAVAEASLGPAPPVPQHHSPYPPPAGSGMPPLPCSSTWGSSSYGSAHSQLKLQQSYQPHASVHQQQVYAQKQAPHASQQGICSQFVQSGRSVSTVMRTD